MSKLNYEQWRRIAFWSQQPTFDRDGQGVFDAHARAARLKAMHEEFGTVPEEIIVDKFQCESRLILNQIYYGACEN